jgi:hypothetical protein
VTWAWASSLDQLWRSPSLPIWITLAAAGFFALILFAIVFRAGKSVANSALAVITLLAIAVAVAATMRNFGALHPMSFGERSVPQPSISLAAIPCLDGLAGDAVEAACERPLFASAESSAAAVSYTAAQVTRLAGLGPQSAADKKMTPELSALRRTVERDRYGLVAHVLSVRDGCTPADCAFYASLTDHNQIAANMNERVYEGLIGRYALSWSNPGASAPAAAAAVAPAPTGKPVSGDFPSATSIPPVSIMTTEPSAAAAAAPQPSKPVAAAAPHPPTPAAKKPAPKKPPAAAGPVPLAPAQPSDDN